MKKILAFFALAVLVGFLGILAYRVPSVDLILVVVLTLGLTGYDMVTSSFRKED